MVLEEAMFRFLPVEAAPEYAGAFYKMTCATRSFERQEQEWTRNTAMMSSAMLVSLPMRNMFIDLMPRDEVDNLGREHNHNFLTSHNVLIEEFGALLSSR